MRTITILGSTGSVGKSVIDVLKRFGKDNFVVSALVAHSDYKTLAAQAIELKARFIAIGNSSKSSLLKEMLDGHPTTVLAGDDGIKEICQLKSDIVVVAISGFASLLPTYYSIVSGSSSIIIASKESLVCAGRLLKQYVREQGNKLLPIDSEHNAIFQVFEQENFNAIDSITITGSGGPFRGLSEAELKQVDSAQALKHPKWSMGKKITIDSATLFNKGLEVIEAHHLFNIPLDNINVTINPECIVHGLVQYKDGSMLAQLGYPDMRIPILHALHWPKRYAGLESFKPLNLVELSALTFEAVNEDLFPSIKLCRQAFVMGEQAMLMLNVANEVAVKHFLCNKIKFLDIFKIVRGLLEKQTFTLRNIPCIEDMIDLEREFKSKVEEFISKFIAS